MPGVANCLHHTYSGIQLRLELRPFQWTFSRGRNPHRNFHIERRANSYNDLVQHLQQLPDSECSFQSLAQLKPEEAVPADPFALVFRPQPVEDHPTRHRLLVLVRQQEYRNARVVSYKQPADYPASIHRRTSIELGLDKYLVQYTVGNEHKCHRSDA